MRQFRGLSGTARAKAVCDRFPSVFRLSDFQKDPQAVALLLEAMKDQARAPSPTVLGLVGADSFLARFRQWYGVRRSCHRRVPVGLKGFPFVFEVGPGGDGASGRLLFRHQFLPHLRGALCQRSLHGAQLHRLWRAGLSRPGPRFPIAPGQWPGEGEWLDRYMVALAEWVARLLAKGYQLQEPEDRHPLAWYRVVEPETGAEADAGAIRKLWQQAERNLARFSGRIKDIQGRPYLHFQDYLRWRGRKARGVWSPAGAGGWCYPVGTSGWRKTAATARRNWRVKVGRLDFYLEGSRYHLCRDSAEEDEEKRGRESLLRDLRGRKLRKPE